MILLDNNQIILASLFSGLKTNSVIDEDLLRHLVLNSYRHFNKTFHHEYGELVICQDSKDTWRKITYPQYKANRAKNKEKSEHDWKEIYRILEMLRDEVKENFPYKDMKIETAEADDIIAVLVKHFHTKEKILIVSNDKDFQQLQVYNNVVQYSTFKKDFIVCKNPYNFLVEHIIRGDSSDGIPNILSDDDVFINDHKRQKRMTDKIYDDLVSQIPIVDSSKHITNWNRNSTLIDFNKIPEILELNILNEYNKPKSIQSKSKILSYMINHKLKNLITSIEEF